MSASEVFRPIRVKSGSKASNYHKTLPAGHSLLAAPTMKFQKTIFGCYLLDRWLYVSKKGRKEDGYENRNEKNNLYGGYSHLDGTALLHILWHCPWNSRAEPSSVSCYSIASNTGDGLCRLGLENNQYQHCQNRT